MRVGRGNREANFIKEEKQAYVQPLSKMKSYSLLTSSSC